MSIIRQCDTNINTLDKQTTLSQYALNQLIKISLNALREILIDS